MKVKKAIAVVTAFAIAAALLSYFDVFGTVKAEELSAKSVIMESGAIDELLPWEKSTETVEERKELANAVTNDDHSGIYNGFKWHEWLNDYGDYFIEVCGYVGDDKDIAIPKEINGKPVTMIDLGGCDTIVSVTIPETITEVRSYGFEGCTSLVSIIVDSNNECFTSVDGVMYSKDMAVLVKYPNNKPDKTYIIPEGVTGGSWDGPINDCPHLEELKVPSSFSFIKSIYSYNTNVTSLVSITVDEKNEHYSSVDGVLFNKDMTSLLIYPIKKHGDSYKMPDSVERVDDAAFSQYKEHVRIINEELKTVTISNNFAPIGRGYGWNNFGLPSKVKVIVGSDCKNFSEIDGVIFSKDMLILYDYPVYKTDTINYKVPDGVEYITGGAFSATSLVSVSIPASVNEMGILSVPSSNTQQGYDFECFNSRNLVSINVDEGNEYFSSDNGVLYNKDKTSLLRYPAGKQDREYKMPNSVKTFEMSTFENCGNLSSISISNAVEYVYEFSFEGCTSLSTLIIPASVTKAGEALSAHSGSTPPDYLLLTIYGVPGTLAEDIAKKYEVKFMALSSFDCTVNDEESGISISGSIPDLTVLTVDKKITEPTFVSYDITVTDKEGNKIKLPLSVEVSIPIPEFFGSEECMVYRKETDDVYTDMKATRKEGYMIFTTDHFSEYILSTEQLVPDVILGDADGNGEINDRDSIQLDRYLAEWGNTIDSNAADLDGDGEVTDKDSIILARTLAGWYN
jgi:hypothetical protein